jgi:hypothetical protein
MSPSAAFEAARQDFELVRKPDGWYLRVRDPGCDTWEEIRHESFYDAREQRTRKVVRKALVLANVPYDRAAQAARRSSGSARDRFRAGLVHRC